MDKGMFYVKENILTEFNNLMGGCSTEHFTELINAIPEEKKALPANTPKSLVEFFAGITETILEPMESFYDIELETENNRNGIELKGVFSLKEDIREKVKQIQEYSSKRSFTANYLQSRDADLRRNMERTERLRVISNMITLNNETANESLFRVANSRNEQSTYGVSYRSYNGRNDGNVLAILSSSALESARSLNHVDETLEKAAAQYENYQAEVKDVIHRENLRFGSKYLKEVLSRILIPVHLIEDDMVRTKCEELGYDVFIKEPTMGDLFSIGDSVHVYSSHDTSDDSSYVAMPVLLVDSLPQDTEELKYLGIGQLTDFRAEHPRSANGARPFVINDSVYVKASIEDFLAVIPEEIKQHIENCKAVASGDDADNLTVSDDVEFSRIMDGLKAVIETDLEALIEEFLTLENAKMSLSDGDINQLEYEINDRTYQFVQKKYPIHRGYLDDTNQVVFRDRTGTFLIVRKLDGNIYSCVVKEQFKEDVAGLVIRQGGGMVNVYDFDKREQYSRREVIALI